MNFVAIGVNHHTASVQMREKIAFNAERLRALFAQNQNQPNLNDLVVVSTNWLAQSNGFEVKTLLQHVYRYEDVQAMTHLMRVAGGLDSLMLGEPQILGQVKSALQLAKDNGVVSTNLNRLFEFAFYAAKRVRTETAVGEHAISMGYAVAQLASQVFSHVSELTVMIVAAGEMNSLVAKHLAEMGVAKIIICNRTRQRAENLAQELGARVAVEVVDFDQLATQLHRTDVVSSCTGSLHQVIHYDDVKKALKQRKYQPMLLVDLAVPRDIDDKVNKLDGIYLYGVDDLQSVIDENMVQRRQAALDAEVMVSQLASQFVINEKIHQAGREIHHYREVAEQQRQTELEFALEQLKQGAEPEVLLEAMSYRLTQKMLHIPSKLFREAAKSEDPTHFEWLNQTVLDIEQHARTLKDLNKK